MKLTKILNLSDSYEQKDSNLWISLGKSLLNQPAVLFLVFDPIFYLEVRKIDKQGTR